MCDVAVFNPEVGVVGILHDMSRSLNSAHNALQANTVGNFARRVKSTSPTLFSCAVPEISVMREHQQYWISCSSALPPNLSSRVRQYIAPRNIFAARNVSIRWADFRLWLPITERVLECRRLWLSDPAPYVFVCSIDPITASGPARLRHLLPAPETTPNRAPRRYGTCIFLFCFM